MDGLHGRCGLEGRATRQDVVEAGSQSVDIGKASNILSARLLRRHEARRTHDLACGGHLAIGGQVLGQAEIRHPWLAILIDQDVAWCQVSVDHAVVMGVLHGLGSSLDDLCSGRRW